MDGETVDPTKSPARSYPPQHLGPSLVHRSSDLLDRASVPEDRTLAVSEQRHAHAAAKPSQGEPRALLHPWPPSTVGAEKLCATEIVFKDFGIYQAVPLNTPVGVTFTPRKPGKYRYTCGTETVAGTLVVGKA